MALGPESTVPSSQRGPALWQQHPAYNVPETDKNNSSNGNGVWRIKVLQLFSSWTPGLEVTADAMSIFNNGEPVPPGWTTHCCCCYWELKFAGIPEGTPRVPAAERRHPTAQRLLRIIRRVRELDPGSTSSLETLANCRIRYVRYILSHHSREFKKAT